MTQKKNDKPARTRFGAIALIFGAALRANPDELAATMRRARRIYDDARARAEKSARDSSSRQDGRGRGNR